MATAELVCHCLLVETSDGLVLVDTGLGTGDVVNPDATLTRGWQRRSRPVLDPAETAVQQVERLGYAATDVRHVVLTHLDLDHGGGLRDFPDAQVHVLRSELNAALAARSRLERERYPRRQWEHGPKWRPYDTAGADWFGFRAVREVAGLPPEILLVPLAGHTVGHTGVAVHDGERWLLHAGDAYFFHGEMGAGTPTCPPALRMMQTVVEAARGPRLENQERLRELVRSRGDQVTVFCAHDPVELRTLQEAQTVGRVSCSDAAHDPQRTVARTGLTGWETRA